VVGGGVNGTGIARDAAGRGLRPLLVEQADLASATSSASTKLVHGGLRYLEYYQFRLVREALAERDVLRRAAPHIIWPLRFVLPHHAGLRPIWMIRLGLLLYDRLGGRTSLPGTCMLNLHRRSAGLPLKREFKLGFEYSDCWVEDSRLVLLNAQDAARRGAEIATRTKCLGATRDGEFWRVWLRHELTGEAGEVRARALVNAAGPWAGSFLTEGLKQPESPGLRMVKGSHIVVPKLFDHGRCYIFQNSDGRICFVIPYEQEFTLIGTTDVDFFGDPAAVAISTDETAYLCSAVNDYFAAPVAPQDVVWSYAGVRPLYDDGAGEAKAATRDYVLALDAPRRAAPLLSVFGGKITTHRRLAEAALAKLARVLPGVGKPWTAGAHLPGGDFPVDGAGALVADYSARYPFLTPAWAARLVRTFGAETPEVLGEARSAADLGRDFGAGLSEREVAWMRAHEWADTADDILWRRTKLGLHMTAEQRSGLAAFMAGEGAKRAA
jgi:glycerol-3-phosphate dehydrogenase